jgi:hypothetical protein
MVKISTKKMRRHKSRSGLFVLLIVALSCLCTSPSAWATSLQLPPHYELEGLTVTPSNTALAVVFHPFESESSISQGTYVYEISPAGEIRQLPATIHGSDAALTGVAPGPGNSVWVPATHGVVLVGESGLQRQVSLVGGEVNDVAPDGRGGAWVLIGHRVVRVGPGGQTHRLALGPLHLEEGCCAYPARLVATHRGGLWIAIVRGREQLTKELVERTPGGRLRAFRINGRFLRPNGIGVSGGRPILQSEHQFLELQRSSGQTHRIMTPDRPCFSTESAEVWCQARRSLNRVFPRGGPSTAPLPQPDLRIRRLAPGAGGRLWYGAENRAPCRAGPSTCATETPGVIVVGELSTDGQGMPRSGH